MTFPYKKVNRPRFGHSGTKVFPVIKFAFNQYRISKSIGSKFKQGLKCYPLEIKLSEARSKKMIMTHMGSRILIVIIVVLSSTNSTQLN